jgi:hypothetical protein
MKYIIILVLIGILAITVLGCTATITPTPTIKTPTAQELVSKEVSDRLASEASIQTKLTSQIQDAVKPYSAIPQTVATIQGNISTMQGQINNINSQTSGVNIPGEINALKASNSNLTNKIDDLKTQYADLKTKYELLSQKVAAIPTTTATTTVSGSSIDYSGLALSLINPNGYVVLLDSNVNQSVSFTVKLTNNTGVYIKDVVLIGNIVCNQGLSLVSMPTMTDLSNAALIYDCNYDGYNVVTFSFTRSTGCPYVYLNANETLTIHPVLNFKSQYNSSIRYNFTLNITEVTFTK